MKIWHLAAVTCGLALAGSASAAPTSLYGNTLHVIRGDGADIKVYMNADGTYSELYGDGSKTKGTWTMNGDKLCMTQVEPAGGMANFCSPDITGKPGDSWTVTGPDGKTAKLNVIAGR